MPLIYACIAPHADDLIPGTAKDPTIVALTRKSMLEMGLHLEALASDVIVIINPHGFRVQNALNVCIAERAFANWSPDVQLEFDQDIELANAIAEEAEKSAVPVVRYIYGASGGRDCSIPLDWGAVVPLYFMGHRFVNKPKIVHLSPMRALPFDIHYNFGRALGRAIGSSSKRIALIASADQAHAHNVDGPYGFDPASAQYDAWMQDVIRSGDLDELLNADPALVENGKPDSLWPTLILAGALKEIPMKSRLLSYEVNGYFGILCAEFAAEE